MDQPLISVIIPVYNCACYLAEAIESVLFQTYRTIEVIVVDDGSTDESVNVARRFAPQVRYCLQSHSGAGAARNKGTNLARGSFFAFLDADDIWLADKLNRQMATFEADPKLDMVFGRIKYFHSPEIDARLKAKLSHDGEILSGYSACTMLIKQKSFFRVGPFTTDWHIGEFIDWYLKAKETGLMSITLTDVVTKRRLHAANMVIREYACRTEYVRILKTSLDRRRKRNLL